MGNINDYCLPIIRGMVSPENNLMDSTLLKWIATGVPLIDKDLHIGLTVAVSNDSYVLAPTPTATDAIWALMALKAYHLYMVDELRTERRKFGGLVQMDDEVSSFNRGESLRVLERQVDDAKDEYDSSLSDYVSNNTLGGGASWSYQEIELREPSLS